MGDHGALSENYLEHFDKNDLLENLEEWERYLRSDPELEYKLRLLAREASRTEVSGKLDKKARNLRGPRP
ncbi:hypothetical protein GCM10007927_02460 [Sulfitobacter pacificus]|uniref:Uncharacterized protein n=1 Tax=Sulfitobacter pacificus TaxID=1499314 RepID=A0ABQ5VD64_9RHOB|nr:hypothetical protein GCM10007927_02460 [Sulfitobacter pacificus]